MSLKGPRGSCHLAGRQLWSTMVNPVVKPCGESTSFKTQAVAIGILGAGKTGCHVPAMMRRRATTFPPFILSCPLLLCMAVVRVVGAVHVNGAPCRLCSESAHNLVSMSLRKWAIPLGAKIHAKHPCSMTSQDQIGMSALRPGMVLVCHPVWHGALAWWQTTTPQLTTLCTRVPPCKSCS